MVFVTAVLWSTAGVLVKAVPVNAVWMVFIRSISAGIILLPFLIRQKVMPPKIVLIAGFCMISFMSTFVIATRLGNVAMAISMQSAAPIFVIVYFFIVNRKIERYKLVVVMFILSGIMLNLLNAMETGALLSIVAGLFCAITFAGYPFCIKRITHGSPLGIVSAVNFVCAGFCILALPFSHEPMPVSFLDVLTLVLMGIFVSGCAQALYTAGLKRISVESAMIIILAEPILNPVWVFLFTGEVPPIMSIIALTLILAGVVTDVYFRISNLKTTIGGEKL